MASKINVTPKVVYLSISKLHSILAPANLLAHTDKVKFVTAVKFHYRVLQLTAVLLTILTSLDETFILLAIIHQTLNKETIKVLQPSFNCKYLFLEDCFEISFLKRGLNKIARSLRDDH